MVYATSHNLPPNNGKKMFSYTNFQKKLPTVGGGKRPPHSVAFTPSIWPPLTNPGCITVTGIAKGQKGPCSPLIEVKEFFKRGSRGLV